MRAALFVQHSGERRFRGTARARRAGREVHLMNCVVCNKNLSYLAFRDAVLCTDCKFVSADEAGACPVCGSSSLLKLLALLDGGIVTGARFNTQSVLDLGFGTSTGASHGQLKKTQVPKERGKYV